MTAEQFAYWFQGFAELSETPPTQAQWDSMREHVATVFKKVTPQVQTTVGPGEYVMRPNIADAIRKWNESAFPTYPFHEPRITC